MDDSSQVLAKPDVLKPIRAATAGEGLTAREPLALPQMIFALLAMGMFVAVVLLWGDEPATALPIGIVGLVLLAFVQVVVLRRTLFKASTVAEIIKALVGEKGLADVVAGRGGADFRR
jgi:hypothetical protein